MGREDAKKEVVQRLRASRLVTLTGPGGVGKTRLALEVAAQLSNEGEAILVTLGALSSPASVLPAVAAALGALASPIQSLDEAVVGGLGDDNLLLVLDNCEHLGAGCATVAEWLLGTCGGLRILATSRERLGATGEVVWAVPPLSLPETEPVLPEAFVGSEAVQLFCERAAALQRAFLPTPDNVDAIVEICRRLDGNPLAIELAAARVVALPPAEIASRLDDRFTLLEAGPSTAPVRQRSFRAALEWSHQLLSLSERRLLCRLSIFPASFGLDAAEAVCGGGDVEPGGVLGLLSSLVEKSLVANKATGGAARFRLLETVRAYGTERLEEIGRTEELAERHAAWCVALVEERPGHEARARSEKDWLARLEAEQDNLLAALDWAVSREHAELALRLVRGQMRLWERRGSFAWARQHIERVLAAAAAIPARLGAGAMHDAGLAALMAGDIDVARSHLRASLALSDGGPDPRAPIRARILLGLASTFGDDIASVEDLERSAAKVRAAGDDALLAHVRVACGQARMFRGDPGTARRHFEESLRAARRAGDESLLADSLVGLGSAELAQGAHPAAKDHLHEGIALAAALGDTYNEVVAATWLGQLALLRGNHDEARTCFEECLTRARAMGAPYPLVQSLLGVGQEKLWGGDPQGAQSLFEEATALAQRACLGHLAALAMSGLGQAAWLLGDASRARAHLVEALALARRRGDRVGEAMALQCSAAQSLIEGGATLAASRSRQTLGEQSFDAEWQHGRVLSTEAAVAYAETKGGRRMKHASTGWEALTPAERRVAALAAKGGTSAVIAEELVVSRRTVETHLQRVYAKLRITSRAQLSQLIRIAPVSPT